MSAKAKPRGPADTLAGRLSVEVAALAQEGAKLLVSMQDKKGNVLSFGSDYQVWYTRCLPAVRTLLPDRYDEFRQQYERDVKRKDLQVVNYVLADYVQGLQAPSSYDGRVGKYVDHFDFNVVAFVRLHTQIDILGSSLSRIDSILADIRGVLQAEMFDSELDAAKHLLQNGHVRAAGALAGVTLEGHLGGIASARSVTVRKKAPTISDYNDALKAAGVFDVTQWRFIQHLGDVRNLCDHKKQREPTVEEVEGLVDGVSRVVKTLA